MSELDDAIRAKKEPVIYWLFACGAMLTALDELNDENWKHLNNLRDQLAGCFAAFMELDAWQRRDV